MRKTKRPVSAFARKSCVVATQVALMVMAAPLALAQQAEQAQKGERIEVTGSRIIKQDFESNSPIVTITSEELKGFQDITLETFLNTLPQINPAGGTTSNNPPNGGQANIDLRGLGSNRNLILIDGRRAMVSASDQTVDLNTIPLALVDSIEIISGGAGAVYGADAISGVVNIKLKKNFQGVDLRAGYSNSERFNDARERNASILIGGNFANGRGNAVLAAEYAEREGLIKSQRPFAAIATATTSFFPEGTYRPTGNNAPTQAAYDALFGRASYGSAPAGAVPAGSVVSFNSDGSLFYPGIFNSPRDVRNFRYPVDTAVNTSLFPDVYVYNFDAVNILVLPLERRSVMGKADYKFGNGFEVFGQFGHTNYTSASALAPTPVSTVTVAAPDVATSAQGSSSLVTPGRNVGSQLIVPVTNPFIPADLRTLLNSRTGDNPAIVGSGATEPFLMRWRVLATGLRTSEFENTVTQYLAGARGPLWGNNWKWDVHVSEGRTTITTTQGGNIDTNRLLATLAAPDGGASLCAGGVNPFGRQPLSAECQAYLAVAGTQQTEFTQSIAQAFISGELFSMRNGAVPLVVGAEIRNFKYDFDPGSTSGPISGFTVANPAGGSNKFHDIFGELSFPLIRNAPWAREFDLHLAYRNSTSNSDDAITHLSSPKKHSNAYSVDINWEPRDNIRLRASAQRSVRAPNFGELFNGGGSAPQIFDPCSVTSSARTGANAAQLRTLCRDAGGAFGSGLGSQVDTFVQTPGTQASIDLEGNRNLDPEKGTSYTLGIVWDPRLRGPFASLKGSLDFYSIKVKDAIVVADPNEYIADCYNYYGRNPSYSPNYVSCQALFRAGDILGILDPNTDSGAFAATNGGLIKTEGIDVNLTWGQPVGPGKLDLALYMNYLLSFKTQTLANFPNNDFTETIPYFGAGFGQAFPKFKSTLTARYSWRNWAFDARVRYIDKMINRASVIFPGEQSFTGVPSTTYFDIGATWNVWKNFWIRAGVNNVADQEARTYKPNVQSGTDPSTYDVIGRRLFVQAGIKF